MDDKNGMAADLSPEDQEYVRRAHEELRRRRRENIYAPLPFIREKMDSMLPGIVVTRPAAKPPVPLPPSPENEDRHD
jgi:hypothetical protein